MSFFYSKKIRCRNLKRIQLRTKKTVLNENIRYKLYSHRTRVFSFRLYSVNSKCLIVTRILLVAYAKGKHSSSREDFDQGSLFTRHCLSSQANSIAKIGKVSVLIVYSGEGFVWNHISALSSSFQFCVSPSSTIFSVTQFTRH